MNEPAFHCIQCKNAGSVEQCSHWARAYIMGKEQLLAVIQNARHLHSYVVLRYMPEDSKQISHSEKKIRKIIQTAQAFPCM